jgi:hypothetical protein
LICVLANSNVVDVADGDRGPGKELSFLFKEIDLSMEIT